MKVIKIDEDVHKEFKKFCKDYGYKMGEKAERFLKKGMADEKRERHQKISGLDEPVDNRG